MAEIIDEILEGKEITGRIEKLALKSKWIKFYSKGKTELIEEIFAKAEEELERINERKIKEDFRRPPKQRIRANARLNKITGNPRFDSMSEEIRRGVKKIVRNKLNEAIFKKEL